jgi:tetratricopeptide (TPR) repeat protein
LLDLPQSVETRSMYDAMDNATRNRGKRAVVAALIKNASTRQPLLLTVEDIHWADPITLEHLAAISTTVSDCPAVLLMTSRIEGDPLDQAWRSSIHGSPLMTIDLAPLRQQEAEALASAFVDSSNRFAIKCIERAQGNPLFLEQLLRDAGETEENSVPVSIQSLVLARMDRLPPPEKQALQAASVIGQRFSRDTLQSLIEIRDYDCGALVAHYLIRPADDGFLFAHALIRQAVYSSLLKSRRRDLHQRVAEWFADRDPTLRAQHLDRADDASAPRAYFEAAQAQMSDYRYERAQQLAERGLVLAKDKADRFTLTCLQGELLHDLGAPAKSIEAYRTALELADDDTKKCRAWIGVAAGMRLQDQFDNVLEALESAEAAARHKDLKELARIHYLRGGAYFMLSKFEDCRKQYEAALDYARKAHSAHAEASALSGLADVEYASGRVVTAHRCYQHCISLCREHGFGRLEVANLPMAALIRLYRADLGGARNDALAAVEAARRVGHRRAELLAASIVFHVLFELSATGRVKEQAEQLHNLARERGSRNWEQVSLLHWGKTLILEGDQSEAIKRLEQALVVSRETEKTFMGARILAALALATDDLNARQQALDEGEKILRQASPSHCHFWFYRDAMEATLNTGDWDTVDRYATALEKYTRAEPLPWTDFFIARGRVLANYGRGRRDDATIRELERVRDEAIRVGFRTTLPALEDALENR